MATRFPQLKPTNIPLDTFARVEQEIRTYFDTIIMTVTVRRDELLQQLNDLKQDYLSKEDLRKKQVQELEQMIGQLDDMSVHQIPNLKFHEDHIKKTKEELEKAEQPTPLPVPQFRSEDLQSLLQYLERIGIVEEMSSLYSYKLKPVWNIGKKGNKKGEFDYPHGIRIEEEKIYVCDSNNKRVQVFSNDGAFLTEFGKRQLISPYDIALCDKWAFVSDSIPNAILKFLLSNFKLMSKSVEVNYPKGLTMDKNEVLLVADCWNHRIAVLNLDLYYLREIGKGMLKYPWDVKTDSNKIFVVDKKGTHNVHVFSKSADLLYSMISVKSDAMSDVFLCLDQFSNIIISNSKDESIQIFTSGGELLIHSIQCGRSPIGIAVTNNNTILCAVDNSVKFY